LVNIGLAEGLEIIDRQKMMEFLLKIKHPIHDVIMKNEKITEIKTTMPGAFEIHINGENDLRATYCALVVADILNLLKIEPKLSEGIPEFIQKCQTYEGGISCIPYGEAHAGYTYCGLASLMIIGKEKSIDLQKLCEWMVNRQTEEGGFNGRIGKLVDSCYNWWVGAISEMLDICLEGHCNFHKLWLINQKAVQGYTFLCCQQKTGGLLDKPLKKPDFYHTNYSLAGLGVLQSKSQYDKIYKNHKYNEKPKEKFLLGNEMKNGVKRLNPIYCLAHEKINFTKQFFKKLDNSDFSEI